MDDRRDKALNLMAKYRRMVGTDAISDPFLLLDDDHVFLRPTDAVPLHTRGMLVDFHREFRSTTYGRYLEACLGLLRSAGLPERNYQIHHPLLIHKAALRRATEIAGDRPTVMGSLYGNIVDGPTVEVARDFKLGRPHELDQLRDGPFVALTNLFVRDKATQAFLRQRLPAPSPWEAAA